MKIDAEKECLIARKFPLPVTIIRPAIVYGPYSKLWTYNIYNRLVNDFKISGNVTAGICNLIYIDDLVQLILLTIGNKNALNMEFNAVGDDNITWEEYFKIFRKEIEAYQDIKRHNKLRINPKVLSAIKSPFMKLAIYLVGNHGKTVFYFYERFEFLRPLFLFLENRLKSSPARHELQLFSDYRRISNKSAKTKLGFSPAFDISRGIKISMQWLARFR